MSSKPTRDPRTERLDRFEGALRAWAGRPPRTPPEEAARRVAERLPERRAFRAWPIRPAVALAAAAFVAAVGIAVWLVPSGVENGPQPTEVGTPSPPGVPVAPAGDVLVIELDPETTLYMTLGDPS